MLPNNKGFKMTFTDVVGVAAVVDDVDVDSSANDFPSRNVSEGSDHSQSRNTKPSMGLSHRSVSYLVDLKPNPELLYFEQLQ